MIFFKRSLQSDGRSVTVRISSPIAIDGDFSCDFFIKEESVETHRETVFGVDQIQALQIAFDKVRLFLNQRYEVITWEAGDVGDHGFRQLVPSFFGHTFALKIENHIENEVKEMAEMMAKNAK